MLGSLHQIMGTGLSYKVLNKLCEEVMGTLAQKSQHTEFTISVLHLGSDGTGIRRVLSDSTAGFLPKSEVIPGYTIRISTGAPVPDGADAVVQVEDTELVKESDGVRSWQDSIPCQFFFSAIL